MSKGKRKISLNRWRHQRGEDTQNRYLAAVTDKAHKPPWIVRFRVASSFMDHKAKVDTFAIIKVPWRKRWVSVPIQVKTSWHGRDHHVERFGDLPVLVFVIPTWYWPQRIRNFAFNVLEKVRDQGHGYEDFYRAILRTRS